MTRRFIVIPIFIALFFLVQGQTYVIDPVPNSYIHNKLGLQYEKEGYYYAAIQEFKIAILLNPDAVSAASYYNNLGRMYLYVKRYDLARPCFNKAIIINPNFIEYYKNLVRTYKDSKALQSALKNYQKQLKANKNNTKALLTMGLIYKEMRNNDNAAECFEEFIKLEPDLIMTNDVKSILKSLNIKKSRIKFDDDI